MNRVILALTLFLASLNLVHAQTPAPPAFPQLGPGMQFFVERDGTTPEAIFVLKVERNRPEYKLVTTLAKGTVFGLEPVPDQVKAIPAEVGVPMVAINGDFFDMPDGPYQGDLVNMFIHKGELISIPAWGDTFWIDAKGQPHLEKVTVDMQVSWPDGTKTPIGIDGPRKDDAAVLYTPILGPSTHTKGGRELVLERAGDGPWLPVKMGQTLTARVREVREDGDTPLAADVMVLSLGPQLLEKLPKVEVGATVTLCATSNPDLSGVELAIGSGPILIKDGKISEPGGGSQQQRHPRTVIGWNDTHFFFIAVDGRRAGWSAGMTISELAALAQRLGCTNALNMDGGGSTTLWLNDQIMNMPSDGKPRSVGNALVLVKQAPPAPAN